MTTQDFDRRRREAIHAAFRRARLSGLGQDLVTVLVLLAALAAVLSLRIWAGMPG